MMLPVWQCIIHQGYCPVGQLIRYRGKWELPIEQGCQLVLGASQPRDKVKLCKIYSTTSFITKSGYLVVLE